MSLLCLERERSYSFEHGIRPRYDRLRALITAFTLGQSAEAYDEAVDGFEDNLNRLRHLSAVDRRVSAFHAPMVR